MPKFKFSKLVRDKIVEQQIASGAKPAYRVLSSEEHKHALVHKVIEESLEILQASKDDLASEIADVQQAIDDLTERLSLTKLDVQEAQKAKFDKNGSFKQGIYIDYVEVADDDKWATYYRKNTDRYPEID